MNQESSLQCAKGATLVHADIRHERKITHTEARKVHTLERRPSLQEKNMSTYLIPPAAAAAAAMDRGRLMLVIVGTGSHTSYKEHTAQETRHVRR